MDPSSQTEIARRILQQRGADWFEAAALRRSRRVFDGAPAPDDALAELTELAESYRPYPDARVVVMATAPAGLFTGLVGSYGKIEGAVSALLFVGTGAEENRDSHVGYCGEALLLAATKLGLDSCWVGGAFDRKLAARISGIDADDTVLAISPLGTAADSLGFGERTMRAMARAHKRKPVTTLAPGIDDAWPEWARAAVDCARTAPSAVNRQPWRFRLDDGGLVVRAVGVETPSVSRRLDCGIGMLHAELGANSAGTRGAWSDLTGDDVARFDPEGDAR